MTAMIELSGIGQTFRRGRTSFAALQDVDLRVEEGQAVAIVGESGAGKTTLMKIVLRLLEPTQGTYLFDGHDVSGLRGRDLRQWRSQVQTVFQNSLSALNPRLSVRRLVAEPLQVQRPDLRAAELRAVVGECLERVRLPSSLMERYPHQLSGGQRQRVAIARALSVSPRLLLLDEPVSALDVSVRAQVLNLLVDLRSDTGMTYLYVTHDLATVNYLCDEMSVMQSGRVVDHLPTTRMHDPDRHEYTRRLLAAVPTIENTPEDEHE